MLVITITVSTVIGLPGRGIVTAAEDRTGRTVTSIRERATDILAMHRVSTGRPPPST